MLKFASIILLLFLFPFAAKSESQTLDDIEFEKKCNSSKALTRAERHDIQNWLKKPLGSLHRCAITPEGIRILIYAGGFSIFFPETIWRKLDVQVSRYLNLGEKGASWIANETFNWINVLIINWDIQVPSLMDYVSRDPDVVLSKVIQFVNTNFIHNPNAYSESEEFTIGNYIDHPNRVRSARVREKGSFKLLF